MTTIKTIQQTVCCLVQARWITVVSVMAMVCIHPAWAFKPTEASFGHTKITRDILLNGYRFSTGPSVPKFETVRVGDGQTIAFSAQAAQQVVEGNQSTDWMFSSTKIYEGVALYVRSEVNDPVAHCDNDLIADCAARIAKKRALIVTALADFVATKNKQKLVHARIELGKLLHTVQDFYAHSNWSDNHAGASIYGPLTTGATAAIRADVPTRFVSTCQRRYPVVLIASWSNNGGNFDLTGQGLSANKVSSGYFDNLAFANIAAAPDAPAPKCDHGLELAGSTVSGINKDAPYSPFTPAPQSTTLWDALVNHFLPFTQNSGESALHVRASYQAALHTRQLLLELVAQIRASSGADTNTADAMVSALLGVDLASASATGPLVGFVIDTTGSMSPIIAGVRTQVQAMIDAAASSTSVAAHQFLLVSYGDPYVGAPFIGTAPEVKAQVAALGAGGGGDCPELTQAGVLAALSAAPDRSVLYVFTDASSKDAARSQDVLNTALAKGITVNYAVSGSCSPIDPTYYQIAGATGGLVLVMEHTQAAVAAAFAGISIEASGQALKPAHIEQGALSEAKTIAVPVEAGTSRLVMQVSTSAGIEFLDPSGSPVVTSATAVVTSFLGGKNLNVTSPAPGQWRVVLTPSIATTYALRADVGGVIDIAHFSFVRERAQGRPGHEAYVPYDGAPPPTRVRLEALMAGSPSHVTINLIDEEGRSLASTDTVAHSPEAFVGVAVVPVQPFRVRISGLDATNHAFERVLPTRYQANTLLLELTDHPSFVRGTDATVQFNVTNYGPTRDVSVNATPVGVTFKAANPATAVIEQGATKTFDITFSVPAHAAADAEGTLNVQASAGADSTTFALPFVLGTDSDGDGVPDDMEQGPAGADPAYDGDGDGVADWTQATVASLKARGNNGYVTLALIGPGALAQVAAINPPQDLKARMPLGGFRMAVQGFNAGGKTELKLILPTFNHATGFMVADVSGVWAQATDGVAAENILTIPFADGRATDLDGLTNGQLLILGGPADVAMADVHHAETESIPPSAGGDSGYTGGGCTVGSGRGIDLSLVLLFMAAMAQILWRWRLTRGS